MLSKNSGEKSAKSISKLSKCGTALWTDFRQIHMTGNLQQILARIVLGLSISTFVYLCKKLDAMSSDWILLILMNGL